MAMPPSSECPADAVAHAIVVVWPALVAQTVASVVHTPVPCDVQALARGRGEAGRGGGVSEVWGDQCTHASVYTRSARRGNEEG